MTINKLLPLLLLALVGCQQVDKREVCARYNASVLDPFEAITALDLWTDDDDRIDSQQAYARVDSYCEFYK